MQARNLKVQNFLLEGLGGDSEKVCTSKNFILYSMHTPLLHRLGHIRFYIRHAEKAFMKPYQRNNKLCHTRAGVLHTSSPVQNHLSICMWPALYLQCPVSCIAGEWRGPSPEGAHVDLADTQYSRSMLR